MAALTSYSGAEDSYSKADDWCLLGKPSSHLQGTEVSSQGSSLAHLATTCARCTWPALNQRHWALICPCTVSSERYTALSPWVRHSLCGTWSPGQRHDLFPGTPPLDQDAQSPVHLGPRDEAVAAALGNLSQGLTIKPSFVSYLSPPSVSLYPLPLVFTGLGEKPLSLFLTLPF